MIYDYLRKKRSGHEMIWNKKTEKNKKKKKPRKAKGERRRGKEAGRMRARFLRFLSQKQKREE